MEASTKKERMRRVVAITSLLCLSMLLPAIPVSAQEANTAIIAPSNTNAVTTPKKKVDFRDPPALMPLLLVPAAAALYLLYEKISRRTQP